MEQSTYSTTIPASSPRPIALRRIWQLIKADLRLFSRDSFLVGMIFYIGGASLLLRFGFPYLADELAGNRDVPFSLSTIYPMVQGYFAIYIGAMIGGMIIGFILLDERDNHTTTALLVSPLPLNHYILYRIGVPVVFGFVFIVTIGLLMNLAPIGFGALLIVAAAGSLNAPMTMLIFATFASNKIEGFALMKIVGMLGTSIIGAWFVETPLQYLFGIFPPYWFVKAYWTIEAGETGAWFYLLVGVIYSIGVLGLEARRLKVVMYQ